MQKDNQENEFGDCVPNSFKEVTAEDIDKTSQYEIKHPIPNDPQFAAAINKAMNDRIAQIKQQYGSFTNIQY